MKKLLFYLTNCLSSKTIAWYLSCIIMIAAGCVFLFKGYDFAEKLRVDLIKTPGSNMVTVHKDEEKGKALTLSFQITGGILLSVGLLTGINRLQKDFDE